MVIPIGGLPGTNIPPGPPPAELAHRFHRIKICVLLMIGSTCGQVIFGSLAGLGFFSAVLPDAINILLNTLVGIWLFRHDDLIGQIHEFLARTCCQPCGEQCPGGMNCLMTFCYCNAITLVLAVLLNGSQLAGEISNMLKAPRTGDPRAIILGLYCFSCVLGFVAQLAGAIFAYLTYKELPNGGVSVTPGDSDWQPYRVGGDRMRQTGSGGSTGSGRSPSFNPGRASAPPQQLFEGSGHRLGS